MEITSCILEVPISFSSYKERKSLEANDAYSSVCVSLVVIFTLSYGKNSWDSVSRYLIFWVIKISRYNSLIQMFLREMQKKDNKIPFKKKSK